MERWIKAREAVRIWGLPIKTVNGLLPHIKTAQMDGKTLVPHDRPAPFLEKCSVCGIEFETYVFNEQFCSDKCREASPPVKVPQAKREAFRVPKIPDHLLTAFGQWRPGKHQKRCLNCLTVYQPKQFYQKTCNKKCGSALFYKLGLTRGVNNLCAVCLRVKPRDEFEPNRRIICLECIEERKITKPPR